MELTKIIKILEKHLEKLEAELETSYTINKSNLIYALIDSIDILKERIK